MEPGFIKADSGNLPLVDYVMIDKYYRNNPNFISAEVKNVKTQRSSRENYSDEAVGFVQLKRENQICIVKAKITPEHKIREKGYNVTVRIEENNEEIMDCVCHDCVAAAGGCKHGVALLFWLLRRSEQPSVTSVECYWKGSRLSKVGKTKCSKLSDIWKQKIPLYQAINSQSFLNAVVGECASSNSMLSTYFKEDCLAKCSLHCLLINYKQSVSQADSEASDFINFCKNNMDENDCTAVELATRLQSKTNKWFEVRYGRITASKIYEATKCKTFDGVLVESILGGYKVPQTEPMLRGLQLESDVLNIIKKKYNINITQPGFIINKNFPIFGASPDGLSEEYCIEIKSPSKDKTISNYFVDGKICKKPYSELQLQMFLSKKKKGLFVVVSPTFESDKSINILEISIDDEFCDSMICAAETFWRNAIFPKLNLL